MAVTYRLKHVGINCENEAEAKKACQSFVPSLQHGNRPRKRYPYLCFHGF